MKHVLRAVGAAMLAAALLGCGPLDFFVMKTVQLFQGPPMTKPLASLEGKRVVLLIDVGNQDMIEAYPGLRYRVAQTIAQELDRKRAAASITNPRDVLTWLQGEPDAAGKSAVDIGRHFNADLVLHVVLENYALDSAAGSDSFGGGAEVGLRVIDVAKGVQVFPDLERFHLIDVRSRTGITAETPGAAEKKILEALTLKVGQVFAAYEVDNLPRKAEVQ